MASFLRRSPLYLIIISCIVLIFLYFMRENKNNVNLSIENKFYKPPEKTSATTKSSLVRKVSHNYKNRLLGYFAYTEEQIKKLNDLIERKALSKDKELIDFVREVMDSPSPETMVKMSRPLMKTPQAAEIENILKDKTKGFFVEAGGLDGERSSNTIYFEIQKQWTGLLIEADSFFYTQLMGKNRNSWSINACVSSKNYVSKMEFMGDSGGKGTIVENANSKLNKPSLSINMVPCFPLHTMLLALNRTHVDFLSLDVEGFEIPILKNIPFDEIHISTVTVEYGHGIKEEYTDLMLKKGYYMHKDIHTSQPELGLYVEDYIFVKNDSIIN